MLTVRTVRGFWRNELKKLSVLSEEYLKAIFKSIDIKIPTIHWAIFRIYLPKRSDSSDS